LAAGIELVRRLRPITFTWRGSGTRDLGLAAEEVARVEPLLVTRDADGEAQGVKYEHLSAVLINAIKEQQAQIGRQQEQLKRQQGQIGQLRARLKRVERRANGR
jgi:hypothetical protein